LGRTLCPVGGDHLIGSCVVDENFQSFLNRHVEMQMMLSSLQHKKHQLEITKSQLEEEINERDRRDLLIRLESIQTEITQARQAAEQSMIGLEIISYSPLATSSKIATALSVKFLGKAFKVVPFVGSAINLIGGFRHIIKGQKDQGEAQIASALIYFIPVVGPAVSVMVDMGVLAEDMKQVERQQTPFNPMTLEIACRALELEPTEIYTKAQINGAYREAVSKLNPDDARAVSNTEEGGYTKSSLLQLAKDYMFERIDKMSVQDVHVEEMEALA